MPGGSVVFTLVEINAGFLAAHKVGAKAEAVHLDLDPRRYIARNDAGLPWERLANPNRHVVPLHDALRREESVKSIDEHWFIVLHTLVESLNDEVILVAIDDQTGEQVT